MKFVLSINLQPSRGKLYYGGVGRTSFHDSKDNDSLYQWHHCYTQFPNLAVSYNTFDEANRDAVVINDVAGYIRARVVRLDDDNEG